LVCGCGGSYQKDVPVQINGNDLLSAALGGAGPYGSAAVAAVREGEGTDLPGYVQFDKTQFQVNTVKSFSGLLGAESLLFGGVKSACRRTMSRL